MSCRVVCGSATAFPAEDFVKGWPEHTKDTPLSVAEKKAFASTILPNKLMSKSTGQALDRIERDVERDFIMTAEQSKEYGIIDDIIDRPRT